MSEISIRAFGRLLGVSDAAVRKAIKSGRLRRSVGQRHGRPVIVDAKLAAKEWQANASRPAAGLHLVPTSKRPTKAKPARAQDGTRPKLPKGDEVTLVDVQKQIALERMRKLKTENDLRAGQLLEVDDVRQVAAGIIGATRGRLLAVPHLAAQQGMPATYVPLIRGVIHAALDELADLRTLADLARHAAPADDLDG